MEKEDKTKVTPAETVDFLNQQILEVTLKIKKKYPELSKYIEEMPVTIPDIENPEVTRKNLKTYYDSLQSMLNKYILEHPETRLV